MNAKAKYLRYTWVVLIVVFLVILAGAVVRMTQSGMGCPDWPTCFGRWIPPTKASQLPPDFEKYLKAQDIDHTFNVYHTWIEYFNRLLGATLGVLILIHFVWSYRMFRKTDRRIVGYSIFWLLAVGFQGWLGKKVVDANLAVVKITTHMLVALLIAAIPLLIIYRVKKTERTGNSFLKNLSVVLLVLLLVQVVLGTQVREQIDEISKSLGYTQRELWIARLDKYFIIHRSFSWAVLTFSLLLWFRAKAYSELKNTAHFILSVVLATITLGIVMAFLNIPAIAQPLHLLLASILVLAVFSLRLKLK